MSDGIDAANRQLWDAWAKIHETTDFYDVESFRAGRSSLNPIELEELGDVEGKSLLHLQCHFGLDTLSWARRGARVTGVDFSSEAIALARSLAAELEVPARFIHADVYELPAALDETFDVVYTSYGVIEWLRDLKRWARIVASYLRPGGTFYMVEFHPFALTLDGHKTIHYRYFPSPEPIRMVEHGSYADLEADVKGVSYAWCHSLGEVVSEIAAAGLRIGFLHEFDYSPYDCYPFTQQVAPGRATIVGLEDKVPLVFSLKAVKDR